MHAAGLGHPVGGIELAAVACLLCGAFVAEVLQLGVQAVENYTGGLPAGVEVAGVLPGGDEAAVEVCGGAAGGLQ